MPLMVSGFIQSIVLLTDSAFLSRYSTLAFDAVGNAGLLFITCFMILVGLGDGTQIILARRIGEKNILFAPYQEYLDYDKDVFPSGDYHIVKSFQLEGEYWWEKNISILTDLRIMKYNKLKKEVSFIFGLNMFFPKSFKL